MDLNCITGTYMAFAGSLFCRFYLWSPWMYVYVLLLYCSMTGFDTWNVLVWTFEDFKKMRVTFEMGGIYFKMCWEKCTFVYIGNMHIHVCFSKSNTCSVSKTQDSLRDARWQTYRPQVFKRPKAGI